MEKDKKAPERIVIEIFGDTYPLRSDEPEHLREIAGLVDMEMKKMARSINSFDGRKIAVLTALKLADDYKKLKDDYDEMVALLDEK